MSKNPVFKNMNKFNKGSVHNLHEQRAFKKRKLDKEVDKEIEQYIEEEIKELNEGV